MSTVGELEFSARTSLAFAAPGTKSRDLVM